MKVMVFVKGTPQYEAGELPSQQMLIDMMAYNEELVAAGIMKDADGLKPSSRAARVRFSGKKRELDFGPFEDANTIVAGYWIWEVEDMEEAIEWVKRCPNPMTVDSDIEIRPVFEMEDFGDSVTPELQEKGERLRAITESGKESGTGKP